MTSESQPRTYGRREITLVDNARGRNESTEESSLLGAGAEAEQPGIGSEADNDATKPRSWEGYDEFNGLPWWRTPTVFWLLGPYFLLTLAFGGMIIPKIELIVTLVCRNYFAEEQASDSGNPIIPGGNYPQCNSAAVQKHVAAFTLVLSALAGGLSAFTAPKLGSLSDRYGRKRLLVIASCGGIINEIITIFTAKYPDVVDYRFLILGTFFDGISGSFTAASVLGNAYVADCTPPSKRGVALGYLQACLFTGLAIGPILAGKVAVWTGSVLTIFYIALGCHIVIITFVWFFVPESVSKRRRMASQEKHQAEQDAIAAALPGSLERVFGAQPPSWIMNDRLRSSLLILLNANPLAPLKMFVPSGLANRLLRRNLLLMGFIDMVLISAALGAGTMIILYAKHMFNWGVLESSRFISIVSVFRVIVLLIVFPIVNYIFRIRPLRRRQRLTGNFHADETHAGADKLDVWLLRLALIGDMVGVIGYTLVRTPELFILSGVFTAFGGLASATIQASVTKQIPAEQVGSMLGAMGLLHAVSRVIAPIIFDGIYSATVGPFPQAFLVVLASLFGVSLLASLFVRPHLVLQEEGYTQFPAQDSENRGSFADTVPDVLPSAIIPRAQAGT
ncbi:MFS general substrate transporter [Astrocystis sublimbata]|nr:MFS general substrate transporter [Astrocystis sublimbata]